MNIFVRILVKILELCVYLENLVRGKPEFPGDLGFFAVLRDMTYVLSMSVLEVFKIKYREHPGTLMPINAYFGPQKDILLRDPKHVNAIYSNLSEKEPDGLKGHPVALQRFSWTLGYNILCVPFDEWKAIRHRTTKFLISGYLKQYESLMQQTIDQELIPQWNKYADGGTAIDIYSDMLLYSSKTVMMAILGLSPDQVSTEMYNLLNQMFTTMRPLIYGVFVFPPWVPTPANRRFKAKKDAIAESIKGYIKTHKNTATLLGCVIRNHTERQPKNIQTFFTARGYKIPASAQEYYDQNWHRDLTTTVTTLVSKTAPDLTGADKEKMIIDCENFLCEGGRIDEKIVIDEIISDLVGGSETTIIFMTFCCYFLATNPEVQEKFRKYLSENKNTELTEMMGRGYLGWVLKEALRLASPANITNKPLHKTLCIRGDKVVDGPPVEGDLVIDKNVTPWFSQYMIHRDPLVWGPDAEQFNPDRWGGEIKPGSFIPFGGGPRRCAGDQYALREAAILLVNMFRCFRVSMADPNYKLETDSELTTRPKERIFLKLQRIA